MRGNGEMVPFEIFSLGEREGRGDRESKCGITRVSVTKESLFSLPPPLSLSVAELERDRRYRTSFKVQGTTVSLEM